MSHKSSKSRTKADSIDEEGERKRRYNLRSKQRRYRDDESNDDDDDEDEDAFDDESLCSDHSSPRSKSFHDSLGDSSRSSLYPSLDESLNTSGDSKRSPQNKIYPDLSKRFNSPHRSDTSSCASPQFESLSVRKRGSSYCSEIYKKENLKSTQKSDKNWTFLISVLVVVFLAAFLIILLWVSPQNTAKPLEQNPFESFIADVHSLEKQLPGQQARLWKTVKASARHILNETESDYPSVILLASQTRDAQVASCVAEKISTSFEKSLDSVTKQAAKVDIHNFRNFNADTQKEKLDKAFSLMLGTNGRRSLVVENLQALSPLASLLLHGYCDNDNAPHKNVMIVFTLLIDPESVKMEDATAIDVENFLENHWSRELDVDKIGALLSRIANNIGVVQREELSKISLIC